MPAVDHQELLLCLLVQSCAAYAGFVRLLFTVKYQHFSLFVACKAPVQLVLAILLQPGAPKNPRAVAETIVAALPSTEYLADTPTLAGPGFINAKISSQWMGARIQNMLRNGIKTWAPRLNRKRVVIDFSSPNVAKEMHVGHLRSTIIGDTLSRTLEFCGADVLRLNHVVSAC